MNRKKAVLKPIEVSDADREYLNNVLASNRAPLTKSVIVRKIMGGYCSSFGAVATQKACFDAHGATLIEKYCDDCVKAMKFRD